MALNDKKRITICTMQKFLFAYKDMEQYSGRKFAVIVDGAHQGQNGESAKTFRRSLIDMDVAVKEYIDEAEIDEVTLDDMPSEKPYTEASLNLDEKGKYITTDKKFRKAFHSSKYNILVFAN